MTTRCAPPPINVQPFTPLTPQRISQVCEFFDDPVTPLIKSNPTLPSSRVTEQQPVIRGASNQLPQDPIINNNLNDMLIVDNMGESDMVGTRGFSPGPIGSADEVSMEELPNKITGTYEEDYNILYVDEIIKKKLAQERFGHLTSLKARLKTLEQLIGQRQTYVVRARMVDNINKLSAEIEEIESGRRLSNYQERVRDILSKYRKYAGNIKTVMFEVEEDVKYKELDEEVRARIALIDRFLDIASGYIEIDVIRTNNRPGDICSGCGISLSKVAVNDKGTIRCPNPECQTEHNVFIMSKLAKDGSRINTNNATDDESIDNYIRAIIRYQCQQTDVPDESLYEELDAYFARHGRPLGAEIRKMSLNERGLRGDTNHKMLWNALSQIGRSEYYEDVNLIGKVYWGWTQRDVMCHMERLISDYNETQKVFFQIPLEERDRSSSLGTQYRLWRGLQLVDHECYMDEFKIAENPDSLRKHNKLWRRMCEGANNPRIRYIS